MAVYREDDTTPKEIFGYHNAGADGTGGSSYIDQTLLREKDANTSWTSASDGTLEQRHYYLQNWRADVVGTVTTSGAQMENQRYFSYGIPFGMYAGDVNGDGLIDSTDQTQMSTWIIAGTYDARGDLDRDGDLDATDSSAVTSNLGLNLGFGNLSRSTVQNRKGYAGYEADPVAAGYLYHVRHRVLSGELGRWIGRDLLRYADGPNLYNYVISNPLRLKDPTGLTGCDKMLMNCILDDPETTHIYREILRSCGRSPIVRCCSVHGGSPFPSGFNPCANNPPQTVVCGAVNPTAGHEVCVCSEAPSWQFDPPENYYGSCPDACETVKHELIHTWQLCNMTALPLPSNAQNWLIWMCAELGAGQ